jgi:hypothetical protein
VEGAFHPAYISKVRIVRERGPIRQAYLPAEDHPITFGIHGPVREHYGTAPGQHPEPGGEHALLRHVDVGRVERAEDRTRAPAMLSGGVIART